MKYQVFTFEMLVPDSVMKCVLYRRSSLQIIFPVIYCESWKIICISCNAQKHGQQSFNCSQAGTAQTSGPQQILLHLLSTKHDKALTPHLRFTWANVLIDLMPSYFLTLVRQKATRQRVWGHFGKRRTAEVRVTEEARCKSSGSCLLGKLKFALSFLHLYKFLVTTYFHFFSPFLFLARDHISLVWRIQRNVQNLQKDM